jgi:hypothetical protein
MKDKVPGRFYREQLVKSPKPDYQKDFFAVEKVLQKKSLKRRHFIW